MKFENTKVSGFEAALRGMRNPKNSWSLSDSEFGLCFCDDYDFKLSYWRDKVGSMLDRDAGIITVGNKGNIFEYAFIGPKDLKLAQSLISAGTEHRKFLRQIFVSVDVTAPLYWYKEFDTYKISTVANSTSTMHKLLSKPITKECFEIGDFNDSLRMIDDINIGMRIDLFIDDLEQLRQQAIYFQEESKKADNPDAKAHYQSLSKKYWKELVRWLPESWLQTRTWTANYETLRSMYNQRKAHKLVEWSSDFCSWIKTLPYAEEFIIYNN